MKRITRAALNKEAKKHGTFKHATTMKNDRYYWMTNEGQVVEVAWGDHEAFAYNVLDALCSEESRWDDIIGEGIYEFMHRHGWLRIGVSDWEVDDAGHKVTKAQRRAIADWCAIAPTRRRFAGNCL